jgi:hypothetical protein
MEATERIADHRADRLAEMVWHLTDCHPLQAVTAVGEPSAQDDSLLIVARAMCSVRRLDLRDKVDLRDKRTADRRAVTRQP